MTDPTQQPPPVEPQQPVPVYIVNPEPPLDEASVAAGILGVIALFTGWCCFGVPGLIAIIVGCFGLLNTRKGTGWRGREWAWSGIVMGALSASVWLVLAVSGVVKGVFG